MALQNVVIPRHLVNHYREKEYIIQPMTTKDFGKLHATTSFSINDYVVGFKKHCPDFGKNKYSIEEESLTASFVSKMIYEVGPHARSITKSHGDKTFSFVFPKSDEMAHTVYVSTYKANNSYEADCQDNYMCLTMRMATLLGIYGLNTLNHTLCDANMDPALTPLCGAIFSKSTLGIMSRYFSKPVPDILAIINSSSASGGQYLADSDAACAVVCCLTSTKSIKDEKLKELMLSKIVKQYSNYGKSVEADDVRKWAQFASSGLPNGITIEDLYEKYKTGQSERQMTITQKILLDSLSKTTTNRDSLVQPLDSKDELPRQTAGMDDLLNKYRLSGALPKFTDQTQQDIAPPPGLPPYSGRPHQKPGDNKD